jgi:hypothetical protein
LEPVNPFREGAAGKYFVGREAELDRFARALTALEKSEPAHLYVAGVNGRGKTSCLEKLAEMARARGMLSVRVPLDGGVRAQQQILAMFEGILRKIDEIHKQKTGAARLIAEWKQPASPMFLLPSSERLQTTTCCTTSSMSGMSLQSWDSRTSSCASTRASALNHMLCQL